MFASSTQVFNPGIVVNFEFLIARYKMELSDMRLFINGIQQSISRHIKTFKKLNLKYELNLNQPSL